MESCVLSAYFDLPTSSHPTLEIYVVDSAGREITSVTSKHIIMVRNDTAFREQIGQLQRDPKAFAESAGEEARSGGDMAIAIDELQWFASLFRREKRIFSQGGEDGVVDEVFKRFGMSVSWQFHNVCTRQLDCSAYRGL